MANEYVNSTAFKATLDMSTESYADADIAVALEAASRAIDEICNRRFWKDADAAQIRYYDPVDGELLRLDDLVSLTELAIDRDGNGTYEEVWTTSDYVLQPYNAAADSKPYETIRRRVRANYSCFPTSYEYAIRVTGKFGWPSVPAQVVNATSILAHKLLERMRSAPMGIVVAMDTAVRIARTDPDVIALLNGLTRGRGPSGGGFA